MAWLSGSPDAAAAVVFSASADTANSALRSHLADPFFPQPALDVLPAAAALDCESRAANQLAAVTRYAALVANLKNEKHRQPFHAICCAAG